MSQKLNSEIAVIGIDIGKNSFHVVGQDRRGAIVLRQKWSRGQVEARLANLPPCLIGMEACTGAHHLSRKLQALGHDACERIRRRWSDRSSRRVRTLVTQLARSRLVRESGRMRADVHDGPEQTLQSEAGYSNARPINQVDETSCTARPDHTVGSISTESARICFRPWSAALPKADVNSPPWLPPLSARRRPEQVQQRA
jgi:hypothetical protein